MVTWYALFLGYDFENEYAIPLRKTGPNVFCRNGKLFKKEWSGSFSKNSRHIPSISEFYIQVDNKDLLNCEFSELGSGVYFPTNDKIQIKEVIPELSWSATDQKFFTSRFSLNAKVSGAGTILFAALCDMNMGFSYPVEICVCIINIIGITGKAKCVIFDPTQDIEHYSWIVQHRRAGHQLDWDGFETDALGIGDHTNRLEFMSEGRKFTIIASVSRMTQTDSVMFDIKEKLSGQI